MLDWRDEELAEKLAADVYDYIFELMDCHRKEEREYVTSTEAGRIAHIAAAAARRTYRDILAGTGGTL